MKKLVCAVALVTLLAELALFGVNDTVISVADTAIADSELSSSVSKSDNSGSGSATVTITMMQ